MIAAAAWLSAVALTFIFLAVAAVHDVLVDVKAVLRRIVDAIEDQA